MQVVYDIAITGLMSSAKQTRRPMGSDSEAVAREKMVAKGYDATAPSERVGVRARHREFIDWGARAAKFALGF